MTFDNIKSLLAKDARSRRNSRRMSANRDYNPYGRVVVPYSTDTGPSVVFTPDFVLPGQMPVGTPGVRSGSQALLVELFTGALYDVYLVAQGKRHLPGKSGPRGSRKAFEQTLAWIDGAPAQYSFAQACEAMGIEVSCAQKGIRAYLARWRQQQTQQEVQHAA